MSITKTKTTAEERVFSGVFPTGIGYADRTVEVNGDYKPLAFPEIYREHMREAPSRSYSVRTRLNVRDSDGTIVTSLRAALSGGSLETWELCELLRRPRLHLVLTDPLPRINGVVIDWLGRNRIRILNVAGRRESREPGIRDTTRRVLSAILRGVARPGAPR